VSSHPTRVRLFAGPNGSGKSAIKERVLQALGERQLGAYLNPDEIEKDWRRRGHVDFSQWDLELDRPSALEFLDRHPLMALRGGPRASEILRFEGSRLGIEGEIDSYLTSALVDHLRHRLLRDGRDMSFESVMSHPDKVAFLEASRAAGCRRSTPAAARGDSVAAAVVGKGGTSAGAPRATRAGRTAASAIECNDDMV